jgi:penicillin-insensitive murein endopeptidase
MNEGGMARIRLTRLALGFAHVALGVIWLSLGATTIAVTQQEAAAGPPPGPVRTTAAAAAQPRVPPAVRTPPRLLRTTAASGTTVATATPPAASPPAAAAPPATSAAAPAQAPAGQAPAAPTVATPAPSAASGAPTAQPVAPPPPLKPAKVLFGAARTPAPLAARAIGSYARGCLSGAVLMPTDGPAWQAMRLSRNRHWGHPTLIAMLKRLAKDGRDKDNWPGLLVGDISQPRGGPMLTGHASHQIGLDADVWLTPMPARTLSTEERETMSAVSMLSDEVTMISADVWTDAHTAIIKRAAGYRDVERVLVHPAIKQVLCYAAGDDRRWLSKVRPYWGHHYHFHIRMRCPPGSSGVCQPQATTPDDDGCGKELDDWLRTVAKVRPAPMPIPNPPAGPPRLPDPPPVVQAPAATAQGTATTAAPAKTPPPPPQVTLDKLPAACRIVLATGNPDVKADVAAAALAAARAAGTVPQPVAAKDAKLAADKQATGKATANKGDASKTGAPAPKAPAAAPVPAEETPSNVARDE